MTLSLIFPMAGQGARFGYRFKPFLNFRGNAFIQAAFQPFRPFLGEIARVYFVFLREQENAHLVSQRLSSMFADVDHRVVILPAPTAGPAETLFQCLTRARIEGKIMVCDCDHALDVGGLMRLAVSDPLAACGLPTWDLTGEPLCSWSVADRRKANAGSGWRVPRRDRLLLLRRRRPSSPDRRRRQAALHLRSRADPHQGEAAGAVGRGKERNFLRGSGSARTSNQVGRLISRRDSLHVRETGLANKPLHSWDRAPSNQATSHRVDNR
jgi:hypothetical protein